MTFATLFGMSDGPTREPTNESAGFSLPLPFAHVGWLPFQKMTIFSHLFQKYLSSGHQAEFSIVVYSEELQCQADLLQRDQRLISLHWNRESGQFWGQAQSRVVCQPQGLSGWQDGLFPIHILDGQPNPIRLIPLLFTHCVSQRVPMLWHWH